MAKIGTLEVRTVKTPEGRIRVVKLPGHEYEIEHFLPEKTSEVAELASRVKLVQSGHGEKPQFIVKRLREYARTLTPTSEAKLARFVNSLKLPLGIKIEEPLAVMVTPLGSRVFYRKIEGRKHSAIPPLFTDELEKNGIGVRDRQAIEDGNGTLHMVDLEHWNVTKQLRKKLGLKYNRD